MSYRNDDSYDSGAAERSRFYWPTFDTLEEAYKVARKSSFGGWAFAGMIALGGAVTYFSGKSAIDLTTAESDPTSAVVGSIIELIFVLFASYRIMKGRAWIVSWVLLIMFGAEAVIKLADGHSFGWIFFYLAVGAAILGGARACVDIHSREKAGEVLSPGGVPVTE